MWSWLNPPMPGPKPRSPKGKWEGAMSDSATGEGHHCDKAGPGAAKFIWRMRKTERFWQLLGEAPGASPQKAKIKGNERPKGQNERKWRPNSQNERKWRLKRPKWKEKWRPKRPKWKEMNAQNAKMKGNKGPKGQNKRKWKHKRPKCKEMKAQKAKMKGNEDTKGQNERKWKKTPKNDRKWRPKRPKWKEMKAQKAKMKGNERKRKKMTENEGPKG